MNDFISRQTAIAEVHEAVLEMFDFCDDESEEPMTYTDKKMLEVNKLITWRIKQLPTADVVEVVMCRNCKKWEQNKNLPYGNCSYHLSLAYATDWCSWAERREDGRSNTVED